MMNDEGFGVSSNQELRRVFKKSVCCPYNPTQIIILQPIIKFIFICFERVTLTYNIFVTSLVRHQMNSRDALTDGALFVEGQKLLQTFFCIHTRNLQQTYALTVKIL